jgi:hypothetical protein
MTSNMNAYKAVCANKFKVFFGDHRNVGYVIQDLIS